MVQLQAGDWITVADAAAVLGMTPRRVQALIGSGRLRATKMNARLFLLLRNDVEAFKKVERPVGRPVANAAEKRPGKKRS